MKGEPQTLGLLQSVCERFLLDQNFLARKLQLLIQNILMIRVTQSHKNKFVENILYHKCEKPTTSGLATLRTLDLLSDKTRAKVKIEFLCRQSLKRGTAKMGQEIVVSMRLLKLGVGKVVQTRV